MTWQQSRTVGDKSSQFEPQPVKALQSGSNCSVDEIKKLSAENLLSENFETLNHTYSVPDPVLNTN